MKTCINCNNPIDDKRTYCSYKCAGQYTENQSIQKWLKGLILGHTGKTKKVKPFVRSFLFKKYNDSCSQCGWNRIHPISKKSPLEANHIDGNAENTVEINLELLCPGCHSLTRHFKNRNKGNGRRNR